MISTPDIFHQFELKGWQSIAERYDSAWSGLVRPFIPSLLSAARVASGTRLLDVACGPGYVDEAASTLGAIPIGLDFSSEMIRIAKKRNPLIEFLEGDAQALCLNENSFDAVVMNFGLLHLSSPKTALAEAYRVIRPGGWYGFTIWAPPDKSPGNRIVEEAVKKHANFNVQLPQGPDYFAFGNPEECRTALGKVGFNNKSLVFRSVTVEWKIPTVSFLFESERDAGVRTAAILAAQKPEVNIAIKNQIQRSVYAYAKDDGFVIPFTAHIVAAQAL